MDFRILGPVEAFAEGRPLPLRGQRQRALLAYLLLHTGEVVTADRLLVELWVDPPLGGLAALQTQIYRLRRLVGDRIVTSGSSYAIRVEPGELDLERFRSLLAEAAATADATERAHRLRTADELWHGVPLAGLELPFAEAEASALQELRLSALEDRLDAELELGGCGELVSELSALVARHPLRERLRGQLILALYRGGRQAEALELCRSTRRLLDEELGLEPSPALRELERAILRHDPSLARVAEPRPRPVAAVVAPASVRRAVPWLAAAVVAAGGLGVGGMAIALTGRDAGSVTTVSVRRLQPELVTRVVRVTTTSHVRPAKLRPRRREPRAVVAVKRRPRTVSPRTSVVVARRLPAVAPAPAVRPLVQRHPAAPAAKPVTISDGFDGDAVDPGIWQPTPAPGATVAEQGGQLLLGVGAAASGPIDVHVGTQCRFPGNFDARVDYTLLEWPDGDGVLVGLGAGAAVVGRESSTQWGDRYRGVVGIADSSVPLPDRSGSLRIVRRGGVETTYVRFEDAWVEAATGRSAGIATLTLQATSADSRSPFGGRELQVAFDNFAVSAVNPICPSA
jgi:DNA-binding SARP family transcriptional activator